MKLRWLAFVFLLVMPVAQAATEGAAIYLHGTGHDGERIPATIEGLPTSIPMACVNCHRESGLGTSESGKTIPPVAWRFLARPFPETVDYRYQLLQNQRPAYDLQSLRRLLTEGIDSRGRSISGWMPRYQIDQDQTAQLVDYLGQLYIEDDPGVDDDWVYIATVVDQRLDPRHREQHLQFLQALFDMKNSLTRGEVKRKRYAPVQKVPQYRSFRKWRLLIWELSGDDANWSRQLTEYYREQPAFVVLAPLVQNRYETLGSFCLARHLPCLFGQGSGSFPGDYFNFVFRDRAKQKRDFVNRRLRVSDRPLYSLNPDDSLLSLDKFASKLPRLDRASVAGLRRHRDQVCGLQGGLILDLQESALADFFELACPPGTGPRFTLIENEDIDFARLSSLVDEHADVCWATAYDRVLERNTREVRVRLLTRKFGLETFDKESLARDLFAFGLLSDSLAQLAGRFSRRYLLEIIEHMLNSYPNTTYYSRISGAPYQRAIVGPLKEFCPSERAA